MKTILAILGCLVLLTGCVAEETFETIADEPVLQEFTARELQLSLPEDASVLTVQQEGTDRLYLCDGYCVVLQTLPGGDLDRTIREVSGFNKDALSVIQTERDGVTHYECAWSAVGEGGDQICRAAILDDGNYHYTVTIMTDYHRAGKLSEEWNDLFNSIKLRTD